MKTSRPTRAETPSIKEGGGEAGGNYYNGTRDAGQQREPLHLALCVHSYTSLCTLRPCDAAGSTLRVTLADSALFNCTT